MKKHVLMLLSVMVLLLSACEMGTPPPEDDFAAGVAQQFYDALHKGEYDQVFALTSEEFIGVKSRDEWVKYFQHIRETLGEMKSFKLKEPHISTRYSGTFYIYEYRSTFEHGLGKELITMVHQINSDKPLRVSGYKIESSKLKGLN